ncbi:ABC transporter ATP-binding protein [Paenibacillus sp. CCS19]|uniref:ABC transporter ATP-binding protein n=1 Tax=Paenibacillus sp. CCS19 TaxID=3158387 RepID=UPI00256BE864|nr:ABC transporter ATP-binding protein [Paenibacillus cellulosilyticus]GMK39266.1 ABC transporter ATP-binding protein [Paenibacillus cellulosilyticus]
MKPSNTNDWVIETAGLTKAIGRKALVQNLNLRVGRGEIYGFLGPNGAGKTTTIRMLLGLIRPTQGSVKLFGRELKSNRIDVLRRVGSLVEYPSYYGHLTGRENLEAVRRILGVPSGRIDEVLSIVRLTKDAGRPVKGYSLGMKQRLGIATALLGNPELLILDEPTNGLDPSGILEMRELIKSMPQQHGITIVVSSHLLSEIEQMATQVGIIAQGRLIAQESIGSLRSRSKGRLSLRVGAVPQAAEVLARIGVRAESAAALESPRTGAVPEEGGNRILVDSVDDEIAAYYVRTLVESGIEVYRVEEVRQSLEDLFLKLTDGEESL